MLGEIPFGRRQLRHQRLLKPPPVRQLERLPEGSGIVVDDVGAGLYALLVMQLVIHFRILSL